MSTHINVAACVSTATGCSEYGKVERIYGLAMKCKYRVRWFYSKLRSPTCSVLVSAYYLCHRINDECLANCLIAPFVDIVLWF